MKTIPFVLADAQGLSQLLSTADAGLPIPAATDLGRTGEIVAVVFRIGGALKLSASGRLTAWNGQRRVVIVADDLARLRSIAGSEGGSISYDAVSGDSVGGPTEVMHFPLGTPPQEPDDSEPCSQRSSISRAPPAICRR